MDSYLTGTHILGCGRKNLIEDGYSMPLKDALVWEEARAIEGDNVAEGDATLR